MGPQPPVSADLSAYAVGGPGATSGMSDRRRTLGPAEEVAALVETEHGRLSTLACALAGETDGAATLLAAARMATARPDRRRFPDLEDDPESLRRAVLVRDYLRSRRTAPPVHDEPLADAELDAVRARLDGLAPLPRAVLVLRHFEELTLADLARVTDRPGPAVARALETAGAAVGATGYQLDLVAATVPVPEPGQVEAARRRLEARRRRVRGRWVLTAVALVAALTGATVLPAALRPDPYVRPVGAWVHGYDVRPTTGLRVVNRFVTPDTDTAELVDADPGQGMPEGRTCEVTATSSEQPVEVPDGRPAQVGTLRGRFLERNTERGPSLWWRTGPRLAVEVSCSQDSSDANLLAVAAMVVPTEVPILLPVDLNQLPEGEEVRGVYDIDGQVAVLVLPAGETEDSPNAVYVTVGTLFGTTSRQPDRTVRVGRATAQVEQDEETETICWDLAGPRACVASFGAVDGRAGARQQRSERLLAIARAVRIAPSGTDRSTWFDAREVVPG